MGAPPLVEIRRLTKVYTEGEVERVVLRDADAVVGRGEFAVLVGRSGSGKSTLLNLMGGLDVPTSGSIRVAGVDLARAGEEARSVFRRTHVAYIFQAYHLMPTLKIGRAHV